MITSPQDADPLRSVTIQRWIQATAGRDVRVGLTTQTACEEAIRVSAQLAKGEIPGRDDDLPDVLHAFVRLVEESDAFSLNSEAVERCYAFIDSFDWEGDEFGERATLKTRLAYSAWKSYLRSWNYTELKRWERMCLANLKTDHVVTEFLALPVAQMSDDLRNRFLLDRPILLALCARLAVARNRVPAVSEHDAKELYSWIWTANNSAVIGNDADVSYFLAETALSISVATQHLGRFADADLWAARAENHFRQLTPTEPWLAKISLLRLTALYEAHKGIAVLSTIDNVSAQLEGFEMLEELCVARFLKAGALKAAGHADEALVLFEQVRGSAWATADLRCSVLMNIAEIQALDSYAASKAIREASSIIQETNSVMSLASLFAHTGDVYRERGDFEMAVKSFRMSVQTYRYAEMAVLAAYVRVLLADALLLAGRDREAVAEVATALPVLEREHLVPDIAHALVLLRKCVDQKRLEPPVLARLRQQLRPWQ